MIRRAQRDDAPLIARAVATAIGDEVALRAYCGEEYLSTLTEIARADTTQYSWRYALVAEVDGAAAGAIVGYDGAMLHKLREGTFEVLRATIGRVPTISDETAEGEYYLDSVAVLPAYRGCGVGCELIAAFCQRASQEGHSRVGLIVDSDNPNAAKLYTWLGFEPVGQREFFGHRMYHLQKRV